MGGVAAAQDHSQGQLARFEIVVCLSDCVGLRQLEMARFVQHAVPRSKATESAGARHYWLGLAVDPPRRLPDGTAAPRGQIDLKVRTQKQKERTRACNRMICC
jgi:hypothetical protein